MCQNKKRPRKTKIKFIYSTENIKTIHNKIQQPCLSEEIAGGRARRAKPGDVAMLDRMLEDVLRDAEDPPNNGVLFGTRGRAGGVNGDWK